MLVIIILASLLIRIDVFVLLIVVFMVLALWELRVDFATVGLHIPVVALWLCSAAILLGTYYSPYHFGTMALLTMATLMLVAILATARFSFGNWLSLAVASKLSSSDAAAREQSSFNHEKGELHHSRCRMSLSRYSPCCTSLRWPAASCCRWCSTGIRSRTRSRWLFLPGPERYRRPGSSAHGSASTSCRRASPPRNRSRDCSVRSCSR